MARLLHHRSDCNRPEHPAAGWDSHLLEIAAFARRTNILILLAEGVGFEPTGRVNGRRFSSQRQGGCR